MLRQVGVLFVVGWTASCGILSSSTDVQCSEDPAPADGANRALIGHDVDGTFVAVADDDGYELHHGLQGGQHIDVALMFHAASEGPWNCAVEVANADTMVVLGKTEVEIDSCASGWTRTESIRLVLDEDGSRDAKITATLRETVGDMVSIQATGTVKIEDD